MGVIINTPKLSTFMTNQLKKRGWSGVDFGAMIGCPHRPAVSKILSGKQTPSLLQMTRIAQMFDVSVDDVVRMRIAEEVAGLTENPDGSDIYASVIEVYKRVPVGEMLKRDWASLADRNNPIEFLNVFGPMVPEFKELDGLAHKTGSEDAPFSDTQKAWIFQVTRLARRIDVQPYDTNLVRQAIERLRKIMISKADVRKIFDTLASAGIRVVFVECKGSKIDGVCTWLDEHSPVIGMTLRFDRDDNFWFILRHELEHVLQGYERRAKIDSDIFVSESHRQSERDANSAAQEFCAPKLLTEQFIAESNGRFTEDSVVQFAEQHGLLPSVLAGQVRHKLNRYNILNKLQRHIRDELVEAAPIVDGWGRVPV